MKAASGFAKPHIYISFATQSLELRNDSGVLESFVISTASNGAGETLGSECTPRGWHRIRAKIGGDAPTMSVFVGRRATGEIYTPGLAAQYPDRDWILSRILWLSGLEPGENRFGNVDTAKRFIYIHGSPDDLITGEPSSHGCIRMKNDDIVKLFDLVDAKTLILIDQNYSSPGALLSYHLDGVLLRQY